MSIMRLAVLRQRQTEKVVSNKAVKIENNKRMTWLNSACLLENNVFLNLNELTAATLCNSNPHTSLRSQKKSCKRE